MIKGAIHFAKILRVQSFKGAKFFKAKMIKGAILFYYILNLIYILRVQGCKL